MLKLVAVLERRSRLVLLAWAAALAAAVPLALNQSDHLSGAGFNVPGSQSEHVRDALEREFGPAQRSQLAAVVIPQHGSSAADVRAAIARLDETAEQVVHVELKSEARKRAEREAGSGRPFVVPLFINVGEDKSNDVAKDLRDAMPIGEATDGVTTHLAGQGALWAGMQDLSKEDLEKAEGTGFPIVFLILLAVFGSLAASLLPLALGVVSVLVTGAFIYLLSREMEMSVFVTNMASMVGIGVAVDYSLFVLARYREEIRAGLEPAAARATALATSGVAVVFSGLTVIVSLAGLWMIENDALRSMALGAILVVAVSVLASATLLPALIRVLGPRAYARGRLFTISGLLLRSRAPRRPGSTRPGRAVRPDFWTRWTARVTRRPALAAGSTALLLLVVAVPTLDLQTGAGALRQFPEGNETRVGAETAAKLLGPGAASPAQIVVVGDRAAAADVRKAVARDPEVARVAPLVPSKDGEAFLLAANTRHDAESDQAKDLVGRLRDTLPAVAGERAEVTVGGVGAAQRDVADQIAGSMWKIVLFVLGLSYIVLLLLLRSVILPLKAVVMNLLSVGAAYGVLVAVFQYGWIDGFLGFESTGHVDTLTPPLVLAVVFGLSMDYEVFLLSRIRERYVATGDTKRAVAEGLAASARTITSAALIMVAVFAVFIGTGVPSIKQLGLGNAVAIAVDATLVRLILVPATMELLGRWNWWLPKPLARVLPRSDFETAPATAS